MDSVEVDGLRVAFERAGTGAPLVLLHGILCDARAWEPQLGDLRDAFDVVAWDAPGCGRSDDPPEQFSAHDYARCLAGLLDALDLGPVHLCGLSWGSGLAVELYQTHPEMVRTLVLTGAYAGWKGSLPAEEVARRLDQGLRESELAPQDFIPGWVAQILTEHAPVDVVDAVTQVMSEFHPVGYRAMARAFADLDLRPVLPEITVPTLLLWGELDRRSPLAVGHAMHDAIPGSELVVLPAVGHLSNVEAPDAFDAAVRDFLTA